MAAKQEKTPGSKRLGTLTSVALLSVGLPGIWWLEFGRVDGFAIGMTAFLVLLAIAVEYVPRQAIEDAGQSVSPERPAAKARWFDRLGVAWLLAIPFAPFFGWLLTSVVDVNRTNWPWLLGARASLCVVVPIVCVLPLLRYVRRGTAAPALAILALGTAFPVTTGFGAAYDVVRGPDWQTVTIERIEGVHYTTRLGTHVDANGVFLELADGRELVRSRTVPVRKGSAQLLVLRGLGRVIDVRP